MASTVALSKTERPAFKMLKILSVVLDRN